MTTRSVAWSLALALALLAVAGWGGYELHQRGARVAELEAWARAAEAHRAATDSVARAHVVADSIAVAELERVRAERDSAARALDVARASWARERERARADAAAGRSVDLPALIGAGDGLETAALTVVDVTDLSRVQLDRLTLPTTTGRAPAPELVEPARRGYWRGVRDGALAGIVVTLGAIVGIGLAW